MDSENENIIIERKRNLGELLKNFCSHDKIRFYSEIKRAYSRGARFIVLCEHGGTYKNIKDVCKYKDKYSRVSGRALMDAMYRAHISYGVEFLFCDKRSTGRKIAEILGCNEHD